MPRTIGTAAQKVDAIRLTTALATTAGQAIAARKLLILSLVVPVLIAGLEHSIAVHSREDQSWPEHMRRREMTLAEEAAHSSYFRASFRMRVDDFKELLFRLDVPTVMHVDGDNPKKFSGVTGLLVLLARLGCTGSQRVVASMLRMDHKRVGAIVLRMVRWISTKWSHVVRDGLIQDRFPQYAASIRHSSGIRHLDIFCFIDCTVRGCARPLYGQEAIYGGHKKKHGLKYQALATPDGLIVCLFGPDSCRHHDLRLLADSALLERIEALQQTTWREWLVYGDPAYVPGQALITGFSTMERASNAAKDWFSNSLNADRTSVEWSFGRVNNLFPFVDDAKANKVLLSPVALFYEAAVFLTNCVTCLEGGNIHYSRFHVAPPTLREYLRASATG